MAKFSTILLFGAPGVGKGTQGKTLHQLPGFYHLASGDVFRALKDDSLEGRQAASFSSRGELVPDELTIHIFLSYLDELISSNAFSPESDLLLLDGIPRNVPQAEILAERFDVRKVISFRYNDEELMVARMKKRAEMENRADDADDEVIRNRFRVYRNESEPVLDFYSDEIVSEIDCTASPVEVLRSVLDCIIPLQKQLACGT